jgi:ubiquinone/menaquinone biosynthesis C-methylase UbiE
MLKNIPTNIDKLADIGCGNGFLLRKIKKIHPAINLYGFDIKKENNAIEYEYRKGVIEKLPYPDRFFDIVICSHVLEHIVNIDSAISELKRITKTKLIIVVPCQRYFYYTLDEHINFFPLEESLTSKIKLTNYSCLKLHGDWVYIGEVH